MPTHFPLTTQLILDYHVLFCDLAHQMEQFFSFSSQPILDRLVLLFDLSDSIFLLLQKMVRAMPNRDLKK